MTPLPATRRATLMAATGVVAGAACVRISTGTAHAGAMRADTSHADTSQPATAAVAGPVALHLPAPTGPERVGVVHLHLVDRDRAQPWPDAPAGPRELMVSVWYPTRGGGAYAPWLTPREGVHFLTSNQVDPSLIRLPHTHGHVGAPLARPGRRLPVLLYSPGASEGRNVGTFLVEELVSRGYLVVCMDHPYDTGEVEFPDGRLVTRIVGDDVESATRAVAVRVDDARFVLDCLTVLSRGGNPDVSRRRLPHGLGAALDLSRVGMLGHSLGAATTVTVLGLDSRVRAGVNLDGAVFGPAPKRGVDRPLLMFDTPSHDGLANDPTWIELWPNVRGWRRVLRLEEAGHNSFTDIQVLLPPIADVIGWPPDIVAAQIGTIDAERAVVALRAYVTAFFDRHLRHGSSRLLAGPSRAYPEIRFMGY